jgi:hypothetical protein
MAGGREAPGSSKENQANVAAIIFQETTEAIHGNRR